MSKVSRNDPCPCGSGKKYKKCCGVKEIEAKKPRLGGARVLPQVGKNPSINLARKVFKVLSAPSGAPKESPAPAELAEEAPKSYSTLEELIGVEGAPKAEPLPQTPS